MAGRWDQQTRTKTAKSGSLLLIEQDPDLVGRADRGILAEDLMGQYRNALATEGAVAFDGTAGAKALVTLTGHNMGTDPASLHWKGLVPLAAPASDTEFLALSASATNTLAGSSFSMGFASDGSLYLLMVNTAGTASRSYKVSGYIAANAGKVAIIQGVRNGNSVTLYSNAVPLTGTDSGAGGGVNWSDAITSTYLLLGMRTSGTQYVGRVNKWGCYNLALAQTDVTEIFELGGAVPERFKFGSHTELITATADRDMSGANNWAAYNGGGVAISGGVMQVTGAASGIGAKLDSSFMGGIVGSNGGRGRAFRLKFTISSALAATVRASARVSGGAATTYVFGSGLTDGAQSLIAVIDGNWNTVNALNFDVASGTGASFNIDNVSLIQVGAICHFDGDSDGIGYQWHDQSTNKLDATLTTTGVTWTKPQRRGWVRPPGGSLSWAGTHEAKSFLGQRCLPNGAVIDLVTSKATVASSGTGFRLVDVNDAAYVTANAFTTAKKVHTIGTRIPLSTSENATNMAVDPDSANYTGSIEAELHYTVTEGNP